MPKKILIVEKLIPSNIQYILLISNRFKRVCYVDMSDEYKNEKSLDGLQEKNLAWLSYSNFEYELPFKVKHKTKQVVEDIFLCRIKELVGKRRRNFDRVYDSFATSIYV